MYICTNVLLYLYIYIGIYVNIYIYICTLYAPCWGPGRRAHALHNSHSVIQVLAGISFQSVLVIPREGTTIGRHRFQEFVYVDCIIYTAYRILYILSRS